MSTEGKPAGVKESAPLVSSNKKVLDSMAFYGFGEHYKKEFEKVIDNIDLQGLENLHVIDLHAQPHESDTKQSLKGIDTADDLLLKDGNQTKLLVFGWLTVEEMQKKRPEIALLLASENVRFLRLPFSPQDVVNAFKEVNTENKPEAAKLLEIADEQMTKRVAGIIHGLESSIADGTKPDEAVLARVAVQAKEYFSSLEGKNDQEIFEFLVSVRKQIPEKMRGENIGGVYCDMEGTLFINGVLNQTVLNTLKDFEANGKQITLWTDGDTTQLQTLLDANGVRYPLKSKVDYAGASAEIVIDNEDKNTFFGKTKIFAKDFIKVS